MTNVLLQKTTLNYITVHRGIGIDKQFFLVFQSLQSFELYLTHSQTSNFTLFKTERVFRGQFEINENSIKLSKLVANTKGKGEMAYYKQFLLFSQCFQMTCTAEM